MGFWHTGYIEFHEGSGIEDAYRPEPRTYPCSHCGIEFQNAAAMRQHRFQAHPVKRPLLVIEGIEVGSTPVTFTQAINSSDIATGACSTAVINGVRIPATELPKRLASVKHDTAEIVLEGQGTTSSFEVRIDVASNKDINGIEKAFLEVARLRRLDARAIEHFITTAEKFTSAAGYLDGICEYLYAVLVKERSPSASLPYAAYREKFNRALEKLTPFRRPLANRIGGLIEFHFNHFQQAISLSPGSRAASAAQTFMNFLSGQRPIENGKRNLNVNDQLDSLLTDWDTERLLRWAAQHPSTLQPKKAQIENMLNSNSAKFDQAKARVLLAEMGVALRNRDLVLTNASKLRNSPGFVRWAAKVIEESKTWSER